MKNKKYMHQKLTSTLSQYDKIVLVGWGTGGHIQPIVSLIHSLDIESNHYLWIGWEDSTEEKTAKENDIEFQSIPTLKLATTRSWRLFLYPLYLIAWFWRSRMAIQILKNKQENIVVFSKWWPGSVAIGLAAWSLSIPLYIHESDTIAGRSNRILGKFADMIFLGFESASRYFDIKKCEVVGQILDPVFSLQHSNTPTLHILANHQASYPRDLWEPGISNHISRNHKKLLRKYWLWMDHISRKTQH